MKERRFRPGEEVVVLPLKMTRVVDQGFLLPKHNDLVTIESYKYYSSAFRVWIVSLVGFPKQDFGENIFAPVMQTGELEKALAEIKEESFIETK